MRRDFVHPSRFILHKHIVRPVLCCISLFGCSPHPWPGLCWSISSVMPLKLGVFQFFLLGPLPISSYPFSHLLLLHMLIFTHTFGHHIYAYNSRVVSLPQICLPARRSPTIDFVVPLDIPVTHRRWHFWNSIPHVPHWKYILRFPLWASDAAPSQLLKNLKIHLR